MNTIKIRNNIYEVFWINKTDETMVDFQAVRKGDYGCSIIQRSYHLFKGEWYVDEDQIYLSYRDIEKIRA